MALASVLNLPSNLGRENGGDPVADTSLTKRIVGRWMGGCVGMGIELAGPFPAAPLVCASLLLPSAPLAVGTVSLDRLR